MARFYPLYVRRSDGKEEITVRGKRTELNQPTDDQLDQSPDKDGVSDFYREVSLDEAKHLDWRRKLGGMMAREMDWKDKTGGDHGHILVTFPQGYRLYEHVKRTEKDGKLEVKSKTHAAGGNDRQDAYLYGHPFGRRKRFRSPADFFPHLLWLCTDESGDPDNCTCKLCCPEELENLIPGAKAVAEKPAIEKAAKPNGEVRPLTDTASVPPARPVSTPVQPKPAAEVTTQVPNTMAPRPSMPSALPPRKTQEQYVDSQYSGFLHRSGEVVWFQRGQRWGLGVVLRRWMSHSNQHHYNIQPLSYPHNYPSPIVKDSDTDIRPWLAWSVPKYTNEGLNTLPDPPRYDTVDWQGLMNKRYGNGDLEVDGSILAAKAIDSSFTLLDKTTTNEPESGVIETHYDGIFLGAEKIWAGDPVRLQLGSGTDIMVVHSIVERKRVSTMMSSHQVLPQSVHFLGDVYVLSAVTHSNPSIPTPASPSNNPHLPQRLTEDLAYRNARSIPARHQASFWRLASARARVDLNDIKGRWFEASRLLPILHPAIFEESARKGDIQESSLWMNSRGDCINNNRDPALPRLPRENVRKPTRRDALGRAVPANTEIYHGLDPPTVDPALEASGRKSDGTEIDPRFDAAENAADHGRQDNTTMHMDNGGGGGGGGGGNGGLDDFMNLDPMDEHAQMPNFGSHGGGYY